MQIADGEMAWQRSLNSTDIVIYVVSSELCKFNRAWTTYSVSHITRNLFLPGSSGWMETHWPALFFTILRPMDLTLFVANAV